MSEQLLAQRRRWRQSILLSALLCLGCLGGGAWLGYGGIEKTATESVALAQKSALRYLTNSLQHTLMQADKALDRAVTKNWQPGSKPAAVGTLVDLPAANCPGLAVLGAQGQILAAINRPGAQDSRQWPADLAWHSANKSTQMRLGQINADRPSGGLQWHVSRRMDTASGEFAGMAACHIDIDTPYLFGAVRTFKDGTSLLASTDGQVLLQNTDTGSKLGSGTLSSSLLEKLRQNADGAGLHLQQDPDGELRSYSWQAIDGQPLLIVNGIAQRNIDALTAPARRLFAWLIGLLGLLIVMISAASMWGLQVLHTQLLLRDKDQQQLRGQDKLLQEILSKADAGQWKLHWPSRRLTVSNELWMRLGLKKNGGPHKLAAQQHTSTFAAKVWLPLIHPEDQDPATDFLKKLGLGASASQEVVIRLRHTAGGWRWFRLRGQTQQLNHAGQTKFFAGLAIDITEEQFARAQSLDRSAQLDAIFSVSPDGLLVFDAHGQVKYANPAFERLTGGRPGGLKDMSETLFSNWLGSLCTAEQTFSGLALLRGKALAEPGSAWELITIEGPPSRILRLSLVLSNSESVSQILYLRDVSHETEVQRVKNQFLTGAAHELRTPMASVVGFAEILVTHTLTAASQQEFARIIWRQSLHLSTILDELLDISRMDARGAAGWLFQARDLAELVAEVVQSWQVPTGHLPPRLELSPMACRVEPLRAQQAIRSVLSNAYNSSTPGSPIIIRQAQAQNHPHSGLALIGIEIQDAGCGMSEETSARAFERFYRADSTGRRLGSGLGLSICQDIMQLMGGLILLSSAPQQGTTVTLLFVQADLPLDHRPPEVG